MLNKSEMSLTDLTDLKIIELCRENGINIKNISRVKGIGIQLVINSYYKSTRPQPDKVIEEGHPDWIRWTAFGRVLKGFIPELGNLIRIDQRQSIGGLITRQFSFSENK